MKVLVVGLGSMGKRRIRNMKRAGITEIVGFDPAESRRAEAADTYGIDTVGSLDEGFAKNPAALIISTPPDKHMEYAMAAAKSGRHSFSEAGTTTEGLLDVEKVAKEKGVVAAASCTMRFQPSIKEMKRLITEGAIGRILSFTHHCGQWLPDWHPQEDYRKFYVSRRETGACREIVPFELTWLNWLLDDKGSEVTAMRDKLSNLDCDIDDVYHLLIRYRAGTIGHLSVDVLARAPVRHTRLIGTDGTIEWSLTQRQCKLYRVSTGAWETFDEPKPRIEAGYSEMSNEVMYDEEIQAFIDAVRGVKPWGNSLTDDHDTLGLLLGAERSYDPRQPAGKRTGRIEAA